MKSENQEKGGEQHCAWCKTGFYPVPRMIAEPVVSGGVCPVCSGQVAKASGLARNTEFAESIGTPVLLLQSDPRLVYTANQKALMLFGKDLSDVHQKRGGQVFDCIHSMTELGCGLDPNCEECRIKNAIVNTLSEGKSYQGTAAILEIKRHDRVSSYRLQISTEKVGELALVRIDQFLPVQ